MLVRRLRPHSYPGATQYTGRANTNKDKHKRKDKDKDKDKDKYKDKHKHKDIDTDCHFLVRRERAGNYPRATQ